MEILKRRIQGDTADTDIIQGAETGSAGEGLGTVGGIELDTVPHASKQALELEKFMAEVVSVHLHEPYNENEPYFVECSVNGDYFCSERGREVKMKRYHLAALAHAKSARVGQKRLVSSDGSVGFQETTTLAPSYGFAVMHDPNPNGPRWLKTMMSNPG